MEEEKEIRGDDDALGKTLVTDDLFTEGKKLSEEGECYDEIYASLITQVLSESEGEIQVFGSAEVVGVDRVYAENSLMDQILMTVEEEEEEEKRQTLMEIFIHEFIEEDNTYSSISTTTTITTTTTTTTTTEKTKDEKETENLINELLEEDEELMKGKAQIFPPRIKPYIPPTRSTPPLPVKSSLVIEPELVKILDDNKRTLLVKVIQEIIATGLRMEILSFKIEEKSQLEILLSLELRHYAFLNTFGEKHIVRKFLKESNHIIRFQRPLRRNNPNLFIDITVLFPTIDVTQEK